MKKYVYEKDRYYIPGAPIGLRGKKQIEFHNEEKERLEIAKHHRVMRILDDEPSQIL